MVAAPSTIGVETETVTVKQAVSRHLVFASDQR